MSDRHQSGGTWVTHPKSRDDCDLQVLYILSLTLTSPIRLGRKLLTLGAK